MAEDLLWTEADSKEARALGWDLVPIRGFLGHSPTGSMILSIVGWDLAWFDPTLVSIMNNDEVPPIAEWVAIFAADGKPLYEKAWLAFCWAELNGRRKSIDDHRRDIWQADNA